MNPQLLEVVTQAAGIDADGHPLNEPASEARTLTLRSPDELLAMQFDDSDIILGDRLLAKGQPLVIVAQGGIGKSRLLLQLCAAIRTGRKFLTFNTAGENLRWLILQTENSNRRLQQDLGKLRAWLRDDWPQFNAGVQIHTVETDDDGFVSLDNPGNVAAIADAIERTAPDLIAIDPLNEFAIGDLNKDADMRATLSTLSRVCRRGNPDRSIVALHHALTGRAGAARAVGFDRSSFGRNSKSLHAWTRGQINLAPADEADNARLVVACGKTSNGREFEPFGIRLDPETMIYQPDDSIDLAAWAENVSGIKSNRAAIDVETVATLCERELSKAELAKVVQEETGCAKTAAYKWITKAESAKKIFRSKLTQKYAKRA